MNLETIERRFSDFMSASWATKDTVSFLRAYVRILLVFKDELSKSEIDALMERQEQLASNRPKQDAFHDLRISLREKLDDSLKRNGVQTRGDALVRMLFGAFLDSDESDFFYLSEPMFEFARKMEMEPRQLKQILESEFPGFVV